MNLKCAFFTNKSRVYYLEHLFYSALKSKGMGRSLYIFCHFPGQLAKFENNIMSKKFVKYTRIVQYVFYHEE